MTNNHICLQTAVCPDDAAGPDEAAAIQLHAGTDHGTALNNTMRANPGTCIDATILCNDRSRMYALPWRGWRIDQCCRARIGHVGIL